MTPREQTPNGFIKVDGELIPTDKWKWFVWMSGQAAKGGPIALVAFFAVSVWLYQNDKHQTTQDGLMTQLVQNQLTSQKSIEAKNEIIVGNHDLLIAGRDRDERLLATLSNLGESFVHCQEMMAPSAADRPDAIRDRKAAKVIWEEILDVLKSKKVGPNGSLIIPSRRTDGGEETRAKNVGSTFGPKIGG